MMINPIDNLIESTSRYGIDLLKNLSLSRNSLEIKFAMMYHDFDPNTDYGIVNEVNTFKPTRKWWEYKCDQYYKQDERFNSKNGDARDLDKCVTVDDFDSFMKMYNDLALGRCHLCGEHFTYSNKPTLDNGIGHELTNCKLACEVCNKMRSKHDDKVTRLRIQLKKFCKLNHFPTTITNEAEYHRLRVGITGGLSNVMHRVNIRGETHINRLHYDESLNQVISRDTPNIVSHVIGIDFNSLYPSSFSSNHHPFNRYNVVSLFNYKLLLFTDDGNISISKCVNENNIAYSTVNGLNKYREKNDLIYKESIEVPFENVQDSSGMWEVKIDMRNATTRLVGKFTDDADVVHNFDFLFDKGDDTAIHTEIFWPEEIDGIKNKYFEQRDDGYWYFNVECFNTKLT